jgi:hypothetical protein
VCGYDCSGSPSSRCPECGSPAPNSRAHRAST